MVGLEEARRIVFEKAPGPPPAVEVALGGALGLTLAEDVASDTDLPPFDASAVDGYAVRAADMAVPPAALRIVGESRAGTPFQGRALAGTAVSILTGGVVPEGADAVVMVERTERDGEFVRIFEAAKAGQNVRGRGEDLRAGDVVLRRGSPIRPQELAVLASVGCAKPRVFPRPRVAVLATGDELVPPETKPGPGQIRESNTFALLGLVERAGAQAVPFGVVRDDPAETRAAIEKGLACDLLLTTGGVAVGSHDFVAPAFEALGIERHFHGVSIKPGKPVWFGTRGGVAVFGLPGNPVSSFVVFETLVRPAIEKRQGRAPRDPFRHAKYEKGPIRPNPRLQCLPSIAREGPEGAAIEILDWTSSADIVELTRANALALVPEKAEPKPGETLRFLPL